MESVVLTNEEYQRIPFSKYSFPLDLPEDVRVWRCKVGEVEFKGELRDDGSIKYWPIEITGESQKRDFHDTRLKRLTEHAYKLLFFEVAKYNFECDRGTEIDLINLLILVKNHHNNLLKK